MFFIDSEQKRGQTAVVLFFKSNTLNMRGTLVCKKKKNETLNNKVQEALSLDNSVSRIAKYCYAIAYTVEVLIIEIKFLILSFFKLSGGNETFLINSRVAKNYILNNNITKKKKK